SRSAFCAISTTGCKRLARLRLIAPRPQQQGKESFPAPSLPQHGGQLLTALRHTHAFIERLAQILSHGWLTCDGQVGVRVAPRYIGADTDQVATLLVA